MTRISVLCVLCAAAAAALAEDSTPVAGDAAAQLESRRAEILVRKDAANADLAREHYALGVWAREHAMPEAATEEFRAALVCDPDHEPAHAALGDVRSGDRWLTHAEAMEAKGLVLRGGAWILREEAAVLDLSDAEKSKRREGRAKVDQLLRVYSSGGDAQRRFAVQTLAGVDDAVKLEPMAYALRAKSEAVRLLAAQELGRLKDRRALRPLVRRAIVDPSADVRAASVDAAKAIGDSNLLTPFARAMDSDDPTVRANAAEAIGRLGDLRGVRVLIWRLEAHGGTNQRVFSSFGTQLTYIQDFDVEVAQTAFIADPQVGVLQEGIVLDAQIHSVDRTMTWAEKESIYGGLYRMTGATDVKREPAAWLQWWKEHAKEYTAAK